MSKEIEHRYQDSFNDRRKIPVGKESPKIERAIAAASQQLGQLPAGREGMVYLWRGL